MKRFVLCADDYALSPAVSRGILRLLERGRISATGAMTNRPSWREAARPLRAFAGRADLGLHLNLTAGAPLGAMAQFAPSGALPGLDALIKGSVAGSLPRADLAAEIARQLDAFEEAMGRAPDFLDGHQHVHVLGGVRETLIMVLMRRYGEKRPYLRDPSDKISAMLARKIQLPKASMISWFARGFAEEMRRVGFAVNEGFSGASAFDPQADYGADFARYLVAPGARHLVMCHPGEVDDELRAIDSVVESRPNELAFFLSERFAAICGEAGLRPGRFAEL